MPVAEASALSRISLNEFFLETKNRRCMIGGLPMRAVSGEVACKS